MGRKSNHPLVNFVACESASRSSGANFMKASDNNIPFTATHGWPIHRSGSITGLAVAARVSAHASDGTITISVLINNGVVITLVSSAVTGAGEEIFYTTVAKGANAISPGDFMTLKQTITAATITTQDVLAIVDVEWNS